MSLSEIFSFFATGVGGLVSKFFNWIISFLPDSNGLPDDIATALNFAVEKLNAVSFIFPVDHLARAIVFILIFEVAMLSLKAISKALGYIRGVS